MRQEPAHRWVSEAGDLEELRRTLEGRDSLALDSESNSGFAYQERLCLLQINDNSDIWLLDLLALPGGHEALGPLRAILQDPAYEILLHGGEFDVGCLKRDYDIALSGIWDTQQAASFLGWRKTGYGAVVEEICGVLLPKAHTRHDWGRRPVKGPELQYAINDVHYLPQIAARLKREVREADLEEEVLIACTAVEQATWNGGFKPAGLWSIKGVRQLAKEGQQVLMALYQWRESVARTLDLPAGRAINNELLLALARNPPRKPEDLKRLGVPRRITSTWTQELLQTVADAHENPPVLPNPPARKRYDPRILKRGDRLKKWRREEAERREVPMQVVLPLAALKHLQVHGADNLESVPQLGTKRIQRYGEALTRLVTIPP